MGRSPIPILLMERGNPLFGPPYEFRYGKADLVRDGKDTAILTTGGMLYRAVQAHEQLKEKEVHVTYREFAKFGFKVMPLVVALACLVLALEFLFWV